MIQYLRHVPLDIFTSSYCDMHGEYILKPPHSTIAAKMCPVAFNILSMLVDEVWCE
jgi:hypothetical protein